MCKRVLCFGDSNTWGYIPESGKRYPHAIRWTGQLQRLLGDQWEVIEEGLNGRTIATDDPLRPFRKGHQALMSLVLSHRPVDVLVIMLGTNDFMKRLNLTPHDLGEHLTAVINQVRQLDFSPYEAPRKILIICPPPLGPFPIPEDVNDFAGASEKSRQLPAIFERVAISLQCDYLNAGEIISVSPIDGIHFDQSAHACLGQVVAKKIGEMWRSSHE